jgi:hypothetical protein
MPRYTVSKIIIGYLLKAKCADYRTLKELVKDKYNAKGIYAYVKMLRESGLVTVAKIVTVRSNRRVKIGIVCLNEARLPEALMLLSKGSDHATSGT